MAGEIDKNKAFEKSGHNKRYKERDKERKKGPQS